MCMFDPDAGYWEFANETTPTLTIRDLDDIIDRLASRADLFGQSKVMHSASDLRDALDIVRRVRDKHLAENYDANRKGEGVRLV